MVSHRKPNRRVFLRYFVGGGLGSVAIAWFWPLKGQAQPVNMDDFCLAHPYNSRCENYFPGVAALDEADNPYQATALLAQSVAGDRILAKGLDRESYLVIDTGPTIANYGISAVCSHLGCTVNWDKEQQAFVCPCHGSRYDNLGQVTHGPAPRSLTRVSVVVKNDEVRLLNQEPAENPRS
jgi:cytochrome b6-f complex iron-sulfur subunit